MDLAANMKYLSDNIPDGRIEPGMDIPVEYAAALESSGEQAVMSSAPQSLSKPSKLWLRRLQRGNTDGKG